MGLGGGNPTPASCCNRVIDSCSAKGLLYTSKKEPGSERGAFAPVERISSNHPDCILLSRFMLPNLTSQAFSKCIQTCLHSSGQHLPTLRAAEWVCGYSACARWVYAMGTWPLTLCQCRLRYKWYKNGLGIWLSLESACLACTKPWVRSPATAWTGHHDIHLSSQHSRGSGRTIRSSSPSWRTWDPVSNIIINIKWDRNFWAQTQQTGHI